MPRPKKFRFISSSPEVTFFKPSGVPKSILEEVNLEVDELESVRLADLEGLYQEDAAKKMNVSRQTFGNILVSAHKKIAEAIVKGKVLRIEGGATELKPSEEEAVCECGYKWKKLLSEKECPKCRNQRGKGFGRRRRQFN